MNTSTKEEIKILSKEQFKELMHSTTKKVFLYVHIEGDYNSRWTWLPIDKETFVAHGILTCNQVELSETPHCIHIERFIK